MVLPNFHTLIFQLTNLKDRDRIRKVMSDKIAEKEKEIEELEIQLETSTHVKKKEEMLS